MKIIRPTLLLDKTKCLQNIKRMSDKADSLNIRLRPHFKTPQSAKIAEWIRDTGVNSCTVSSVKMAEYFFNHGWKDITIAFPVNMLEAELINKIAKEIQLNIIVVSKNAVSALKDNIESALGVFIKIDTGTHRTGVSGFSLIDEILEELKKNPLLEFKGFLSHSGHTYHARSVEEVEAIHSKEIELMSELKQKYISAFPHLEISVGDTPSCSISKDFEGITEIRPGNYIFYDVMQQQIGSCSFDDIAVCLACPVVAKHPERNEIIVHGGAVHLSKDFIRDENDQKIYGYVVKLTDNGWSDPLADTYVRGLSQEHGIIRAGSRFFEEVKEGQIIGILPVHSCLTADAMNEYYTLEGEKISMMSKTS
jgi:D-serine deaminase-like pyridoxal phosphate-dependent protein